MTIDSTHLLRTTNFLKAASSHLWPLRDYISSAHMVCKTVLTSLHFAALADPDKCIISISLSSSVESFHLAPFRSSQHVFAVCRSPQTTKVMWVVLCIVDRAAVCSWHPYQRYMVLTTVQFGKRLSSDI